MSKSNYIRYSIVSVSERRTFKYMLPRFAPLLRPDISANEILSCLLPEISDCLKIDVRKINLHLCNQHDKEVR